MQDTLNALLEADRRKPNPKNRVEPKVEVAVTAYATDYPAHGQVRVSNELRKQGIVENNWQHELSGQ